MPYDRVEILIHGLLISLVQIYYMNIYLLSLITQSVHGTAWYVHIIRRKQTWRKDIVPCVNRLRVINWLNNTKVDYTAQTTADGSNTYQMTSKCCFIVYMLPKSSWLACIQISDSNFRFKKFIVNQRQTEKHSRRSVQDTIMNIISALVYQHSWQEFSYYIFNMWSLWVERDNYIIRNRKSYRPWSANSTRHWLRGPIQVP